MGQEPLTDAEIERILEFIPKVFDWILAGSNPQPKCVFRRSRFVQFVFSEKNQGESFASFARRSGETPQAVHEMKLNFSKAFSFYFHGSYATKKRKIRIS